MTIGEQLYLGLVLLAFFIFGLTLAIVSTRTNRYMRGRAAGRTQPSSLKDAA